MFLWWRRPLVLPLLQSTAQLRDESRAQPPQPLGNGLSQRAPGQGHRDGNDRQTDRAELQAGMGKGGRRQGFVKTVAAPSGLRAHPYFKHQLDKQNKNQRAKQGARLSYQKGFQWYLPCPPVPLKFVAEGEKGQLPLQPNGSVPQPEPGCV